MKDRQQSWSELMRSLIGALIEVLGAEWAVLMEDWRRWGKLVAMLAALASVIFSLVFCFFALGVVLTVVAFELWLGAWWKALLLSLLLIVVITAILTWLGARVARRAGTPLAQAQARWRDHQRWWREQVLVEPPSVAEASEDER